MGVVWGSGVRDRGDFTDIQSLDYWDLMGDWMWSEALAERGVGAFTAWNSVQAAVLGR